MKKNKAYYKKLPVISDDSDNRVFHVIRRCDEELGLWVMCHDVSQLFGSVFVSARDFSSSWANSNCCHLHQTNTAVPKLADLQRVETCPGRNFSGEKSFCGKH
jgi:isopentenyldiphosphate isomerase